MKVNVKKKLEKKKCVWLLATMLVAIFIIALSVIHSYAYEIRYVHYSDKIDMSDNSITYRYYDNENEKYDSKSYTISDNWVDKMSIRHENLTSSIGTNTTIFGPYTWLPAGRYKVTIDFTYSGARAFEYWDVAINFGDYGMPKQHWDSKSNVTINDTGMSVQNPNYNNDDYYASYLTYTIDTTGDAADYELRFYFTSDLGHTDLPSTGGLNGSAGSSAIRDFIKSIKIESEYDNTITYDANGGTLNNQNTGTLTTTKWGKTRGNVAVPTREGYTFTGWHGYRYASNSSKNRSGLKFDTSKGLTFNTNSDGNMVKLWNADGTPENAEVSYNDYTVYAGWKLNEYTITYSLDGGSIPSSNPTSYNINTDTFTLNNPVKPGYVFAGWTGTGLNSTSTNVTIKKGSTGNRTYKANWVIGTARIQTFSGKGISSTNYSSGADISIGTNVTVKADVKNGYKFVSWTDSNGNTKASDKDYTFTMPNTTVNLTANATPISYNIVFDSNKPELATSNVTGSTANISDIKYDTSVALTTNGYNLNGWKFNGWNTKADGTGISYADKANVKNLSSSDGATITLYAQWVQGDGYVVTVISGKGIEGTTGSGTYKDGDTVNINITGIKKGYTWKDNETTTGWFMSNHKISSNKNYKFTMTPNSCTYIANATPNTYKIVYNRNKSGAIGTIADSNYTYDIAGTLRVNMYTSTGYTQTGWNTKADGTGTHYDVGKAIEVLNWTDRDNGVINLYAEWSTNSYAVTYIDVLDSTSGKELGRTQKNINYGTTVNGSDLGSDRTLGKYYSGYVYNSSTSAVVGTSGATVYRVFKIHNYNISYNLNGGFIPDGKTNPASYNVETNTFTLNNPVKPGYTFTGWSGTELNGNTITVKIKKGSVGDRTYIANWKTNEYIIKYTRGETDVSKDDVEQKVFYNEDVTTKSGDTFTGRTYSVAYNQGYTNNRSWETTSLPFNIINKHLTFKSWSINNKEYTANTKLTKPNFATNGTVIATANWNPAYIKLQSVTRVGYTFAGWKCSADNKVYAAGTTYTITPETSKLNVTFTAQWTANKDIKYVVRHWKQKLYLDGTTQYTDSSAHNTDNYFLADTDNFTGTTDSSITPDVKKYEGFTSPDVQTVTINGDGSLIVDYYYTRNKYKVDNTGSSEDDNGGNTGDNTDASKGNGIKEVTGGGTFYYEEEVAMEAVVKNGYHWHAEDDCNTDKTKYPTGWTVTKEGCGIDKFIDNTNYTTRKIKFIMPAHDVCVKADATNNSYTIKLDANGGTGSMEQIDATYNVPITLPNNTFTRTTTFGDSKFLYWEDRKNDATYLNKDTVISLTDNFNGTVILYASWDNCPEITAQERWFTVDDSQNGKITLEELLSTAKAEDDRDDDIANKLTVKYYQPNVFTQFKTDGYVMVTYTATDSSNNTTEVTVKVNIVDTVAVEQEKNTYVRFIGPDYYQESYENGGLEEDSIWKKNPDYAAVLERAMNNRESMYYEYKEITLYGVPFRIRKQACEYSDHLLEKWVFTKDDVKAVKEYINQHGIGNLKEADALANFRTQFAYCRQQ